MNESAIQPEGRGEEEEPELGTSPAPQPSGPTDFLVENPSAAGITREALIEAVQSLGRERDYLRRARDIQLADFEEDVERQRQHCADLEAVQLREARAHREEAETLQLELAAVRTEIEKIRCERQSLLAVQLRGTRAHQQETETLKLELAAVRTELDEILGEHQRLLADRDAWKERANIGLVEHVRRELRGFRNRVFRSS